MQTPSPNPSLTLKQARQRLSTNLVRRGEKSGPLDVPPRDSVFQLIKYPSKPGELSAYLTKDPGDQKRHPAIIWITGGDSNSIGDVWSEVPRNNDQSASAYPKAGIVTMFPSLRGGNDNPGRREGFFGEVDDVLAAATYLETLPYVDSNRIYLGGHSTGGTLVLLVAETSNRFRSTFAFGAVDDIRGYGGDYVYAETNDDDEMRLRSPVYWLSSINSPVFVLEGSDGNSPSLRAMALSSQNSRIKFIEVDNTDHFAILAPVNEMIAQKLLSDTGSASNIQLEKSHIDLLFVP